jgi:NAD(P)-dependent dehydrogenase (short-subunit alcohol dehydrogenase family)
MCWVTPVVDEIDIPEDDFPPPIDVRGRAVVVTGATRGLGRVLVTAFARSGASVGLVARNQEQLRTTMASLPGQHVAFAGDIRDEQFNLTVADAMRAEFGHLDVWVATAGVSPVLQRAQNLPAETWRLVVETNLTGVFYGAKAAAQVMRAGGRIIVTSSVIGQRAMDGLSAYSASKGAVDALVRTLAIELGGQGITVNGVAPGWFDSPMAGGVRANETLNERIIDHTALRRWGQAADLPGAYLFLASEASRFLTGAVIPVDGGYLLK